jgi:hypothetical protein
VDSKPPSELQSNLKMIDPLRGKDGTVFDKPAPSGPPTPLTRGIPPYYKKLVAYYEGIIGDEGLIMDLCLDRAVGIVEFNYRKRLAGSDFFGEQLTAAHFVSMAAPLAVELYKQTLASIAQDPTTYARLLVEAKEEMERGQRPGSSILTP